MAKIFGLAEWSAVKNKKNIANPLFKNMTKWKCMAFLYRPLCRN